MVPRMNFTELSEATSNFSTNNSNELGKIKMMYKVVLPNGSSFQLRELLALGTLKHNNLVPILGSVEKEGKTSSVQIYIECQRYQILEV
ncbi:hypothetical protein CFP56_019330 [Quercus suber]|uniref:Protein kinase domain-containing protein n=1 Tax=Quercus suber TaxID=58331 RepID=A0AAW0KHW9_QUESU